MGTPSWIYHLFALAMLLVAGYSLSMFVLSIKLRDTAGRDIDVAHLFMGTAMAGMFVTSWTFWPSWSWEAIFFILMIWFLTRTALSVQRFGLHIPHEATHATMSFAMLLMYLFPLGASGPSHSMTMSGSSSHAILDPGIGFLLAFCFFASAVFTLASPEKGASHHGTHVAESARIYATSGAANQSAETTYGAHQNLSGIAGLLASPRLEDLSHVVMCVSMGFMLILML